jgi:hypothetical protein
MGRRERLAAQAETERAWAVEQQDRPNFAPTLPAPGDPDYCALNVRGKRHSFWTSKRDGRRHCHYCCAVRPPREA